MSRLADHRKSKSYRAFDPSGQLCWHGCGRPASTRDHVPALALHHHVEGSGCCELRPACGPCNFADGQAITSALNKRRAIERAKARAERKRERFGLLADEVRVW